MIPAQEASDGVSTINGTGATGTNAVVPTSTTTTSNTSVAQAAPTTNALVTITNTGSTTDTHNTAANSTTTATNFDHSAVESTPILDTAAARAERRKTILEKVVVNQQASLAAYLSPQQLVTQSVTELLIIQQQ